MATYNPLKHRLNQMNKQHLVEFGLNSVAENVRLQKRIGEMRSNYRRFVRYLEKTIDENAKRRSGSVPHNEPAQHENRDSDVA